MTVRNAFQFHYYLWEYFLFTPTSSGTQLGRKTRATCISVSKTGRESLKVLTRFYCTSSVYATVLKQKRGHHTATVYDAQGPTTLPK